MKKLNICSEGLYQRCCKKYLSYLFVAMVFLVYGFLFTQVSAYESVTKDFIVTSGADVSSGASTSFSGAEIEKLSTIDQKRIQSNATSWPQDEVYNEDKYLEFNFSPDVPEGVVIDSVIINNNFRRSGALLGAKLEVWDGENFVDQEISKGSNTTTDNNESVNVSSYINNKDKVDNLKVRFLAYRSTGGSTKTSHDFIGFSVTYHIPDVVEEPPAPESEFTEVSGIISEDTTWTRAESPYIITGATLVDEGVTLTIEPGVIVKFNVENSASLSVFGKIIANGEEGNEVFFTSNYDDQVGGSTDEDYEDCYYEDYDEEGNPTGNEICEIVDWYDPGIADWDGLYFRNSSDSVLKNVSIRYASDAIAVESSSVYFENLKIEDSFSGITGYNNSNVEILGGFISKVENEAFTFFTNSTLSIEKVNISDVYNGFTFYGSSDLNIKDSSLSCSHDGLTFFTNSNLLLSKVDVTCEHDGIVLFNDAGADINGAKVSGATEAGIIAYNNTKPDSIKVTKSEITGNDFGFIIWDSVFEAHQNSIHGNTSKGVETYLENPIDFTSNYWGNKTGPKHTSNPSGVGDIVSDNILFEPFLKYDPLKNSGLSNIMFIPGFQASRMYKMVGSSETGTEFENKLWEPGILGNVSDMYMDENGESVDKSIYTRDVVDEANIFGLNTINFYKSFMLKMDNMVSNGEISAWKPIAYDWRQSQLDIVNRGIEKANGDISYTEELNADQVPYIIGELQKLSNSSDSGKVTIVTHSNGGLVAKALIAKLIEMKNSGKSDLVDKIDNLIEVAPPLVGTPKAVMGILHGYNQGVFGNMLVGRKSARDFGQNIGGAYGLLPSKNYLSSIENDQILLDSSLDKVNNWRQKYGDSIDTYEELENFLVDISDNRVQPSYDDLVSPIIINKKLLDKAKLLHDKIDNLVIPDTIQVHQVIGWGLPTPYSFSYKSKNECLLFSKFLCSKKKVVLSSDIDFTSGGDGTVVEESAAFGEGKEYYLNLKTYNKDNKFDLNKDHVDIFEVPYVFDLVHNILKSDSTLPEYTTSIAPGPVDYTVFKMRSPVSMNIYDGNGLHTGLKEGSSEEVEEGIPNSLYMEFGDDKYLIVPKEGNYTLKLAGLSDGIFTLEQEEVIDNSERGTVVFKDIPTTSLLKGELDINDGALANSISIDKEGDGTFEEIEPTNTNTEEEPKNEEVKVREGSSGGYSQILALNTSLPKEEFIKKESVNKIDNKNQDDIKKINQISKDKQEKVNESVFSNGNVLGASTGSAYSPNPFRFKLQLVIVGGFILLLLSLKFIFKVL